MTTRRTRTQILEDEEAPAEPLDIEDSNTDTFNRGVIQGMFSAKKTLTKTAIGSENVSVNHTNLLFMIASEDGKSLNLTKLYSTRQHFELNNMITLFRSNKNFTIGFQSPTIVTLRDGVNLPAVGVLS